MRLMLTAILGLGFLLSACSSIKPEANPDKYVDYRSDNDLLERLATLDVQTAAYVKKGPPNKMTNRRELGGLADEMAADQLRQKAQIERELAKRYRAGDKKAYFEGIENVPLQ